jgi:hypothetical protein
VQQQLAQYDELNIFIKRNFSKKKRQKRSEYLVSLDYGSEFDAVDRY